MKKLFAVILAVACLFALAAPSFAVETINKSGDDATTQFTLTAEASTMTVTVPTSLPINVTNETVATVGAGIITNGSAGIVEVKSIKLNNGTYRLETYADQTTFNTYDVGSKKLGLNISFGGGTDSDSGKPELTGTAVSYKTGTDLITGTAKALTAGTLKIAALGDDAKANTLSINTVASVSPTGTTAINGDVAASMVIVVGWYTGA